MDDETKELIRKAAQDVALGIGRILGQDYREHNGEWWLFTMGQPMKPLTDEEVEWHVKRGHAPFVNGGIMTDDPRWWDGA